MKKLTDKQIAKEMVAIIEKYWDEQGISEEERNRRVKAASIAVKAKQLRARKYLQ